MDTLIFFKLDNELDIGLGLNKLVGLNRLTLRWFGHNNA